MTTLRVHRTDRRRDRAAAARRRLFALVTLVVGLAAAAPAGAAWPDGTVLGGAYADAWESSRELDALGAASGKRVALAGTFHHLFEGSDNTYVILEQVWQGKATPVANIEEWYQASYLASGAFDAAIDTWAESVSRWLAQGGGRSLFIAPLQEMNGDWVPWGMDPESFKIVYRKFVAAFASRGIDETKVRWVFAPNGWSSPPFRTADYYPGSDVVDVVGFSAYNVGGGLRSWVDPWQVVGAALDDLHSFAPDKPYFITQVGSAAAGGDRDRWVRELFHLAEEDPHVAGLVYFNLNREIDWRVFDGLTATPGWVDSMARPTTRYEWPLTGWFQPGPLPFVAPDPQAAPTLCAAAPPYPAASFVDLPGWSWYRRSVDWAAASGITAGHADGTFRPDNPVSRAEAATFLARLSCSIGGTSVAAFPDVPADAWFTSPVEWMHATGLSTGFADGTFRPAAEMTRAELITVLWRLAGAPPHPDPTPFPDVPAGSWAAPAVSWAAAHGVADGYPDGGFHPDEPVDRAETTVFLRRFADNR